MENSNPSTQKIVLMFPGQGSQHAGMGKSLYEKFPAARDIINQANDVLGYDLKNILFNGTDQELKQTQVTQPAIFTVSCAAFEAFVSEFPDVRKLVSYSIGHSLGEYSALFASGVFDFQTGIKLVQYRGKFIQDCCDKYPGTMAAIIGIKKAELAALCRDVSSHYGVCEPVNFNTSDQIVVAGTKESIEMLLRRVSEIQGSKGIALNVSGAFHSSLMKEASEKMLEVLQGTDLRDATIPVIANCDAGKTVRSQDFKDKLSRQINNPVLWEDSMNAILSENPGAFLEMGPGKVLTGILRKIDRKKKALNVEDEQSLIKTRDELSRIVSVPI